MITRYHQLAIVIIASVFSFFAYAANEQYPCLNLEPPFMPLTQSVMDPNIGNPPQVQLCHRTNNAAKHLAKDNIDKTINELYKLINEVNVSTPTHITIEYAQTIISEAEQLIASLSGNGPTLGTVSGGVYYYGSNFPVANISVTLAFSHDEQPITSITDDNGLFQFVDLQPNGTFIVTASDGSGASGTAQETLLETKLQSSVIVTIDQSGNGQISGLIKNSDGQIQPNALIRASFPDSGRIYTTYSLSDGSYLINGVHTDGTVILIGFDNDTGASTSYSSFLLASNPSIAVNLQLEELPIINPELLNAGFQQDFDGWSTSGPAFLVDRSLVFGSQN